MICSHGSVLFAVHGFLAASLSTASAVKPGFFSHWGKANLRSFITQCLHGIDFGGAPRRQVAGGESHRPQKQTDQTERQRVSRSDSKKQARQETSEGHRARQTEYDPTAHQDRPVSQDQTKHVPSSRA